MSRPRVLLIEDDASIRRFVEMALEDMPIDLQTCETLAQARVALAQGPIHLLITDLMLPDGSGLDLLAEWHGRPGAPPHIAVFSAGVTGAVHHRLDELGITTVLPKPASIAALEACVRSVLPGAEAAAAAHGDAASEATAIAEFFGGDAALFRTYRASCLGQFGRDIAAGDASVASGDLAAFRRVVHSLKTVLRMLGQADLAAQAARQEDGAARADPAATAEWPALRDGLARLAAAAD